MNEPHDSSWAGPANTLHEWQSRAETAQHGHRMAAKYYAACHNWAGGGAVLFATATATTLAAQIQNTTVGGWVIAVLGTIVALLTALQTFKKFDARSQAHDILRADFASVCRNIEQVLSLQPAERGDPEAVMNRVRVRLDELSHANTPVPERIWKNVRVEVAARAPNQANAADTKNCAAD